MSERDVVLVSAQYVAVDSHGKQHSTLAMAMRASAKGVSLPNLS